ncbi:hypothetical protein [Sphingomonas colocasiae]|uniref:Uncharacterized protein n=1 Tax=Sphingomonas colocasiae TaxID=1848973 RepID=A0ABS7PPU0_9SPHN|nr:hypothetical protein [Sphingomonas colocasiae]MBY8823345.1 hypothetical protein [Sphingomonas colocasiae]
MSNWTDGMAGLLKAVVEFPANVMESLERAVNAKLRMGRIRELSRELEAADLLMAMQEQQQEQQQQQQETHQCQLQRPKPWPADGALVRIRADGTVSVVDVTGGDGALIARFNDFLDRMNANCRSIKDMLETNPALRKIPFFVEIERAIDKRLKIVEALDDVDGELFAKEEFREQFFEVLLGLTQQLSVINKKLEAHLVVLREKIDLKIGFSG